MSGGERGGGAPRGAERGGQGRDGQLDGKAQCHLQNVLVSIICMLIVCKFCVLCKTQYLIISSRLSDRKYVSKCRLSYRIIARGIRFDKYTY